MKFRHLIFVATAVLASCGSTNTQTQVLFHEQNQHKKTSNLNGLVLAVAETCSASPAGCAGAIAALNLRAAAPAAVAQIVQQLAAIAQQAAIANPAAAAEIVGAVGRQAVVAAEVNPAAASAVLTATATAAQNVATAVLGAAGAMVQTAAATASAVSPSMTGAQRQAAAAEVQAVYAATGGAGGNAEVTEIIGSLAAGNVPETDGGDLPLKEVLDACPDNPCTMDPVDSVSNRSVATRAFLGPTQAPSSDLSGVGFIAFPTQATQFDTERHRMICEAFLSTFSDISIEGVPTEIKFATYWPLLDSGMAQKLKLNSRRVETRAICESAVEEYDYDRARRILHNLRRFDNVPLEGRGPFLLAWNPSSTYLKSGELLALQDFSRVNGFEQAQAFFEIWRQKVESDPISLKERWSMQNIRWSVSGWGVEYGQVVRDLIQRR